MHIVRAASRAASLAMLSYACNIHAQSDSTNQNITLRFFQNSQEDSCDYSNSSLTLTFTTSSVPLLSHCFDFRPFQRKRYAGLCEPDGPGVWGEAGIQWKLGNVETFDSQGSYSSVLYRQHITDPASDDQRPGHYANRRNDPSSNETLLDWYGFSCWSEDKGSCGTLPYKITSFSIPPGPAEKDQQGTCWVFAKEGAAARIYVSSQATTGAFVSAFLAIWLAM
ncbi:hypothetical protein BDV96DRAFT_610320 [Lophiotrema nucula]|uniref:Uncharacterized protein n=1 Tax=Lophiotrema nucula TaxID=690887 RepID=A0A6A5ZNC8_9PLEO|nr:hypothetical protein BDV96DRAFT_610320 [Lophiotrema nucula]